MYSTIYISKTKSTRIAWFYPDGFAAAAAVCFFRVSSCSFAPPPSSTPAFGRANIVLREQHSTSGRSREQTLSLSLSLYFPFVVHLSIPLSRRWINIAAGKLEIMERTRDDYFRMIADASLLTHRLPWIRSNSTGERIRKLSALKPWFPIANRWLRIYFVPSGNCLIGSNDLSLSARELGINRLKLSLRFRLISVHD